MKILILCRYSRLGASSRLRFYQYIPLFEAAGISCDIHPLLNARYLAERYANKPVSKWNLLKGYVHILNRVLFAGRYDCVLIEKEVFPFLPLFAEWWLNRMGVPFITDYDDAIFHNYDLHPNPLVRLFLGHKIAGIMRRSSIVMCGNEYLMDYAVRAGARQAILMPTVIDTSKYRPKKPSARGQVIIGWIGSPYSAKYLRMLRPVLASLVERFAVSIHIVGAPEGIGLGAAERVIPWSEDGEADLIAQFDIGIMPLEDTPWERGKCGYKLIQYMGCALPVVGSPVGVNEEIIRSGVNGFKPVTLQEWTEALEALVGDTGLREMLGLCGRKMVEEKYSLEIASDIWIKAIKDQHHVRDIRRHTLFH